MQYNFVIFTWINDANFPLIENEDFSRTYLFFDSIFTLPSVGVWSMGVMNISNEPRILPERHQSCVKSYWYASQVTMIYPFRHAIHFFGRIIIIKTIYILVFDGYPMFTQIPTWWCNLFSSNVCIHKHLRTHVDDWHNMWIRMLQISTH